MNEDGTIFASREEGIHRIELVHVKDNRPEGDRHSSAVMSNQEAFDDSYFVVKEYIWTFEERWKEVISRRKREKTQEAGKKVYDAYELELFGGPRTGPR